MTQDGMAQLAERARADHMQALGLTPAPWHLATPQVRAAWISTVALVLASAKMEGNDA
jgi:hypothetical protein